MNKEFGKLKFKETALKNLRLPHIQYPIPIERFKDLVALQGQLYPDLLIYWMMEYLDDNPEDRDYYEIQLLKICEDFAEPKDTPEFWQMGIDNAHKNDVHTGEWSAYFGHVDLKNHIITLENKTKVICAYQQFNDTKDIKISFYTAPTLYSLYRLRIYGHKYLTPEREFNSLAHLEKTAGSLSNAYNAYGEAQVDYFCMWKYGIGYNYSRKFNEEYAFSQNLNAIPGSWVVFCIKALESVETNPSMRELAGLPPLETPQVVSKPPSEPTKSSYQSYVRLEPYRVYKYALKLAEKILLHGNSRNQHIYVHIDHESEWEKQILKIWDASNGRDAKPIAAARLNSGGLSFWDGNGSWSSSDTSAIWLEDHNVSDEELSLRKHLDHIAKNTEIRFSDQPLETNSAFYEWGRLIKAARNALDYLPHDQWYFHSLTDKQGEYYLAFNYIGSRTTFVFSLNLQGEFGSIGDPILLKNYERMKNKTFVDYLTGEKPQEEFNRYLQEKFQELFDITDEKVTQAMNDAQEKLDLYKAGGKGYTIFQKAYKSLKSKNLLTGHPVEDEEAVAKLKEDIQNKATLAAIKTGIKKKLAKGTPLSPHEQKVMDQMSEDKDEETPQKTNETNRKGNEMSDTGIIYVLTNPAMEGYVKIGKTVNLEDRLKSLYNTSVPLPFHCNKAVRVNSMKQVEEALHSLLSKNRTNKNREFFEIEPENAYKILDALALEDVTPGQDFVENHSDTEALKRKASQRPPIQMISMLGLKEGDRLTNSYFPDITCTVKADRKVLFRDEETTLTNAMKTILDDNNFVFNGAATVFWQYNGETLRHLYKEYYSDFDT